jgi:hypothetical protein
VIWSGGPGGGGTIGPDGLKGQAAEPRHKSTNCLFRIIGDELGGELSTKFQWQSLPSISLFPFSKELNRISGLRKTDILLMEGMYASALYRM